MELWACGFNAWGQLNFDPTSEVGQGTRREWRDLTNFQCVLRDEKIEVLRTGLSCTLVNTSRGLLTAGMPDELAGYHREHGFDSMKIAEASNGKIAAASGSSTEINTYASWSSFPTSPSHAYHLCHRPSSNSITHLVAGATSFAALTTANDLYTWGDERYSACLGRDIAIKQSSPSPSPSQSQSPSQPSPRTSPPAPSPAGEPGLVTDLQDLDDCRIKHVSAAGGYVFAVLSAENDAYVWGVGDGLSGTPEPVDLDGQDVLDIAAGEGHMLAVTRDQRVWIWGQGTNGQLGQGNRDKVVDWEDLKLVLPPQMKIERALAGERSSFLILTSKSP